MGRRGASEVSRGARGENGGALGLPHSPNDRQHNVWQARLHLESFDILVKIQNGFGGLYQVERNWGWSRCVACRVPKLVNLEIQLDHWCKKLVQMFSVNIGDVLTTLARKRRYEYLEVIQILCRQSSDMGS